MRPRTHHAEESLHGLPFVAVWTWGVVAAVALPVLIVIEAAICFWLLPGPRRWAADPVVACKCTAHRSTGRSGVRDWQVASGLHDNPNMTITRAAATKVIDRLLVATGALDETLRLVQAEVPESQFRRYRKVLAEVMGAIYLDLMRPVVKDYSDLDPGVDPAS